MIASGSGVRNSARRALRPLVRSRSPIAENDQRIGMLAWSLSPPLPPDAASPNLDTAGNESRQSLREDSTARSDPADATIDLQVEPRPGSAAPPAAAAADHAQPEAFALDSNQPSLPATHPVSPRWTEDPDRTLTAPGVLAQDGGPAPIVRVNEPAPSSNVPEPEQIPGSTTAARPSSIPSARPRPGTTTNKQQPPPHSQAPFANHLADSESQVTETDANAAAASQPERPRALPSVAKEQARESDSRLPLALPGLEGENDTGGPQVVIDRLEIEVVLPQRPPDPQPSRRIDPKAGNAQPRAPISQIGPLSQSTASRHYLAMRYR